MEHKTWHNKAESRATTVMQKEDHVNDYLANPNSNKIMEHLVQVMTQGGRSGGQRVAAEGEGPMKHKAQEKLN